MISRHWAGVVKRGLEHHYINHLERETFPSLARLPGFVSASILRRSVDDGIEFRIVTVWRSLDAIRAFAGDDLEAAVVPPVAAAMMVRYDRRAVHYEVVGEAKGGVS